MSIDQLFEILYYISSVILICSAGLYIFYIQYHPRTNHYIGILLLFSLTSDLFSHLMILQKDYHLLPHLHNLYFLIQFCLLSLFYYEIIFKTDRKIYVAAIFTHYFVSIGVLYYFSKGLSHYHGITRTLTASILIAYACIYFYKKNRNITTSSNQHYLVWINAGVIFYFTLALWLYIIRDERLVTPNTNTLYYAWFIHNIGNITKNILFAKGIYEAVRYSKAQVA